MSRRNMLPELVIDPEFESYVPPLMQEEFDLLEENILCMHRVMEPIIVWNRNIIIDGHNRYRIAQKHPEIPFTTADLGVETREEALDWICRMQLGRRNLTPEQRKFLTGKRYKNEKHAHGGDRRSEEVRSSGQNDHLKKRETVRARIAREMGTSESYIQRAAQYAKGLDLMDEVVPGIRNEVLLGIRKIPETEITAIAKADASDRDDYVRALLNGQSAAELIRRRKAEGRREHSEALQQIEVISLEMEKPKAKVWEAEGILDEMEDALSSFAFRWNHIFDQPHNRFSETELSKLRTLFSEGLDFITEFEKRWEEYHADTDN